MNMQASKAILVHYPLEESRLWQIAVRDFGVSAVRTQKKKNNG